MTDAPQKGESYSLLTAQAARSRGHSARFFVVPANSIFLNAYGSKWLPATYIAIAVLGSGASALIARAARRTRLVRVATVSLSALAVLYGASWLILVAGGLWMSAFLLVLFPIALQVGFVFIGGQAGRLLDVRQMKERFPRVIGGFVCGVSSWEASSVSPSSSCLDQPSSYCLGRRQPRSCSWAPDRH